MSICAPKVLTPEELGVIRNELQGAARVEGASTASWHVDAPVMGGLGSAVRTDLAITLFLSDAKSHTGGDLMVESNGVEYGFKPDAGSAIAYPANSLHHVTPVTRSARHAAIIWVQSQVRDSAKRELLWELDNAKRQIFGREGKSPTFDAISKPHANLLRMWADV